MTRTPCQFARTIEETSLNAWPSLKQILYDGWILRFAHGYSRRNNSVNAFYPGNLSAGGKIKRCEDIYRARGLPPTFRITPFVEPANLDTLLAELGYQKVSPTSVQVVDLAGVSSTGLTADAHRWETPAEEWVDACIRINEIAPVKHDPFREILAHIPCDACFMVLQNGAEIVACGLGVLDGPCLGLFDIVIAANQRGKGLGTQLVSSLFSWAKQHNGSHAYLQVVADNTPALNLYAKLGFREIYRYWYRVK